MILVRSLGMVWVVASLYAAGFVLPVAGFGFFFREYSRGRKRQLESRRILARVEGMKARKLAGMLRYREQASDPERFRRFDEARNGLDNWAKAEARERGAEWASYRYVGRVAEDSYFGTLASQLHVAKRDVFLVGGGVLCATVASIWSLWL